MSEYQQENDADLERVKASCLKLSEHFDSVQIFVTKHAPEQQGTVRMAYGSGNYFARFGKIIHWLTKEKEAAREEVRNEEN